MPKYIKKIIILIAIFSATAHSDVLIIDRINTNQAINIPAKGLSMNQVLSKYGEPVSKNAAVGQPPIVKWQYGEFSVYFENNWVISSVIHKTNDSEKGPKPINQ
jgi:hypothetical protein